MRLIRIYLKYAAISDLGIGSYAVVMRTPYVSKRYMVMQWVQFDNQELLRNWCLKYRFSGGPGKGFYDRDYGEMEYFQYICTGPPFEDSNCCGEMKGYYHMFGHCGKKEPRLPEVCYLIKRMINARNLKSAADDSA